MTGLILLLVLVGLGAMMSTKEQRAEARARLVVPGRIVGAITAAVVVILWNWPAHR